MPVIITPDVITDPVVFPGMEHWLGSDAKFLYLGAMIFIIALSFVRGNKNQNKNELTV